jgi:glucose-6-phosphate 1-epimerase
MTSATELDDLNARFALSDQLRFHAHADGVLLADISNSHATARIALQGAQVLTYQPQGAAPVLWLSTQARGLPGKTIRGGIPVCWPWFGPHPDDAGKPAHGYVRAAPWEVRRSSASAESTQLVLGLPLRPDYQALFPHAADLDVELAVGVGAQLRVSLTTRNTGTASIPLSQALHTYFTVSDIAAVQVLGLEDCEYIDKVGGGPRKRQQGPISIAGEVDRIYLNTDADSVIDDPGLQRRIRIAHDGSRSTVVWNPWIEKAEKMGDLGPDGYRHMLCVENTNAADDTRQLAPGGVHTLTAVISVEAAP